MSAFTPREIVSELDRFIVGQADAKRCVAIALRNRWRRLRLEGALREDVIPKNIILIGPTGCGKTEIARRLAKLADAPFIKVEATKFTEVGYVGRDVEQIIRDLVEIALVQTKERMRRSVEEKAKAKAEERLLEALVGNSASDETREKFKTLLREDKLDDREVEIHLNDTSNQMPTFEIPGMPGAQLGMMNIGDMLGKAMGSGRTKQRKVKVPEAWKLLIAEESENLLDQERATQDALKSVEENGIVFLDEIDKISARSERSGSDVSREGVQRDLLPLLEGTTVTTKHGMVKTDHILFITSGAFHLAKPSDLLPELQGRLPIRVELHALGQADYVRILKEPETSLVRQYVGLLGTEGVNLVFTEDGIDEIAKLATDINTNVENIGARRLHTVMERLVEDISFSAPERKGETFTVDAPYVQEKVGDLAKNADLSKFIL